MTQSSPETERIRDTGDPDHWEKGELRRSKEVSATLSFRVNPRFASEIETFADSRQISVSDLIRRAVETYMQGPTVTTYSNTYFTVTGTTFNATLQVGGPTTMSVFNTSSARAETIDSGPRLPLLEYGFRVGQAAN
jgi:hypothetical protein